MCNQGADFRICSIKIAAYKHMRKGTAANKPATHQRSPRPGATNYSFELTAESPFPQGNGEDESPMQKPVLTAQNQSAQFLNRSEPQDFHHCPGKPRLVFAVGPALALHVHPQVASRAKLQDLAAIDPA